MSLKLVFLLKNFFTYQNDETSDLLLFTDQISSTLPNFTKHLDTLKKKPNSQSFRNTTRLSKRNLVNCERNDIDENEEFKSENFSFSKKNKLTDTDYLLIDNKSLIDDNKCESFSPSINDNNNQCI